MVHEEVVPLGFSEEPVGMDTSAATVVVVSKHCEETSAGSVVQVETMYLAMSVELWK